MMIVEVVMSRQRWYYTIAVLFATGAFVLGACGSNPPEPADVTVVMDEYSFTPDTLEFQVGQQVTLTLVNTGELEHEIMFGKHVTKENGQPSGYLIDLFEIASVEPAVSMHMDEDHGDDEHSEGEEAHEAEEQHEDEEPHMDDEHAHGGFMVLVPAGDEEYTITFTVTKDMVGEWEIGCFLLDGTHYTGGMHGTMKITG